MEKYNRRKFLKTVGYGTAALATTGLVQSNCSSTKNRPNILILFTDDQRFNTIHALNCPEIHTPNMDKLVQNGVSFTRAHIMGGTSGAVCMPSRAMLLTGKTLFHLNNRGANIPDEHIMFPELFRKAGYKTFGTGKWHNSRQAYARCFTHGGKIFFGGMSNHLEVPVYDFDPTGKYEKEDQYIGKKFSSNLFSDAAIQFLENDADENPFLMYISYTAPHDPRMAPKEYADMYNPEKIPVQNNFMPQHPFDNGEMTVRDEMLAPFPRTKEIVQEHIAAYYAMITHLDAQIGRILDALERSGKAENTVIVFAGDNGLALGNHGLMGKQNLYDHSVRVPLVISGPGIPRGAQTETLCYLSDIYPTLCQFTGFEKPGSVEGKSLVPALQNNQAKIHDSVFLAYTKIHRGVRRNDNWKLIKYNVHGEQRTQLFNLNDDPDELKNLADQSEFRSQQAELTDLLFNYMTELGDFCDLTKPNWGLPEEILEKKKVQHLAIGKKIKLVEPFSPKHPGNGPLSLVDGTRGTSKFYDGVWQGFHQNNLEAIIDLGSSQKISKISVGFIQDLSAWIFFPSVVEFTVSGNGTDFTPVKTIKPERLKNDHFPLIKDISALVEDKSARFVKVKAQNVGTCPNWHQGAGEKAWLFADEIMVH